MYKLTASGLFLLIVILASALNAKAQACPFSPGCLDPTFGGGGTQLVALGSNGSTAQREAVVQSDGKVVSLVYNATLQKSILFRLNTDGSLDNSFGSGGKAVLNWSFPSGSPYGIAVQNVSGEERLVLVGTLTTGQGWNAVTILRADRYRTDGSLDTTFGTNGSSSISTDYGLAVTVHPVDQKIYTVGPAGTLVRLNPNGSLDTTYGTGGKSATGMYGAAINALPDGKVLVGGQGSKGRMAVMRINANGSTDASFGTNGRAFVNFGSGTSSLAFDVIVDPFGNIVAGGSRTKNGNTDFAAARFTSNGQPDLYFNGTGNATYDFSGLSDEGRSAVVQSDGKVVLSGSAQIASGKRDYGLIRLNYNGSRDLTFGTNGRVTTDIDGTTEFSNSAFIWIDPFCSCEKVIMAGSSSAGASFARYTTF